MALVFSPIISKDQTAEYKYICKALRYFAAEGQDGGERHELNTIYQSLSGALRLGDEVYKPANGTYISVDRWTNYDNLGHQEKNTLKNQFDADQARKVMGGNHEIDLVAERLLGGGAVSRWLVECKSGGAASTQPQMTSYVETILWMTSAPAGAQHRHFFGHCMDSPQQPSSVDFQREAHRFLMSVIAYAFGGAGAHIAGAHPDRFRAVKQYLVNLDYSTAANAQPNAELSKILAYEATNPLAHPLPVAGAVGIGPMTVYGAAAPLLAAFPGADDFDKKLNEVLIGRFGFGIGLTNFTSITDTKVKEHYHKIEENYQLKGKSVHKIAKTYIA